MKKLLSLSLILILVSMCFTSCKKDKGDPPVLPPVESMTIDFANFVIQKKSAEPTSVYKGAENSNWEFAAVAAGIFRIIVNTTLIVPVSSFRLAIEQTPVYVSEKNWQWSYDVVVAGSTYKARLTGSIGASEVQWKMYISKEGAGGFAEFVWFEGTSKTDGTSGKWILNQSSAVQVPVLRIDWSKSGALVGKVTYTIVKTGDPYNTSYIEYGLTSSTLNAYYKVHYYNSIDFSDLDAEWSTTTKNGRVKCIDYLGDDQWHCWDANKINVVCP
jgi:hypothetical protein